MSTIRITIERGIVQDVDAPAGVEVIVRDYDVDGASEDSFQTDDDGHPYIESIWPAK